MSVDIYSYAVPEYPDVSQVAAGVISFLSQAISTSYVTSKSVGSSVPSWALEKEGEPTELYNAVSSVLSFHYHGTDFCFVSYVYQKEGVQSQAKLRIYAKNPQGGVATELVCYVNSGNMSATNWNFLIGQNDDYFVFTYASNSSTNYHYCVFRIDAPTNTADTGAYISVIPGTLHYNKAFAGEDISQEAYLVTDAGKTNYTGGAYASNFVRNLYNNKIPLYNIYAFSRIWGVRGKITSLAVLPNSYSTKSDTFYSINGIVYVGLNDLNGEVRDGYNGILLRVY